MGAAEFTPLVSLGNDTECEKCQHHYLPGSIVPREDIKWAIHSDLPEIFHTEGVLYATVPVLPPFETHKDGPLPEPMRTQLNHGYKAIDGPFEVFIYHLSEPGKSARPRRLVVLATNDSDSTVTLAPRQIFEASGKMGTPTGPETRLAVRVFEDRWETPIARVDIPARGHAIVSATDVIAAAMDAPGQLASGFITGMVQATTTPSDAPLQLHVIALSAEVPEDRWTSAALALREVGAKSGETAMDLRIPPPPCHLRRVVGVYRNFRFEGAARIDVGRLPEDNLQFQMALPAAQAKGCEQGIQTQRMTLHPPYVHPETIGNYTAESLVTLELVNSLPEPIKVGVRFGKQDASVGLVWKFLAGDGELEAQPVRSGWAGPWAKGDRADETFSFHDDESLEIAAGATTTVRIRLAVIGTASLPYQLHLTREN
jgi:hypothetical protein